MRLQPQVGYLANQVKAEEHSFYLDGFGPRHWQTLWIFKSESPQAQAHQEIAKHRKEKMVKSTNLNGVGGHRTWHAWDLISKRPHIVMSIVQTIHTLQTTHTHQGVYTRSTLECVLCVKIAWTWSVSSSDFAPAAPTSASKPCYRKSVQQSAQRR